MKSIHKFFINTDCYCSYGIVIPVDAQILSVGMQADDVVLYILMDISPTQRMTKYSIKTLTTGQADEDISGYTFIGSIKNYHVFAKELK